MPDINRIIETISDEETEHSSQTIEALEKTFSKRSLIYGMYLIILRLLKEIQTLQN